MCRDRIRAEHCGTSGYDVAHHQEDHANAAKSGAQRGKRMPTYNRMPGGDLGSCHGGTASRSAALRVVMLCGRLADRTRTSDVRAPSHVSRHLCPSDRTLWMPLPRWLRNLSV